MREIYYHLFGAGPGGKFNVHIVTTFDMKIPNQELVELVKTYKSMGVVFDYEDIYSVESKDELDLTWDNLTKYSNCIYYSDN